MPIGLVTVRTSTRFPVARGALTTDRTRWEAVIPWDVIAAQLVLGIGAALAIGTGVALVRYWRTGAFPGQEGTDPDPDRRRRAVRWSWVKIAIGVVVSIWALATLEATGVL